jgi:WD40 repeat protein
MEQQHSQEQAQPGVLSPPPQQQQQQQSQPEQPPVIEFGAYYSRTPVRQYCGHGEDILDVSWSPSGGFLLSASLDKSVRLWHLSQPECLRAFEHSDFVTSVQFHPSDAQRFVSGAHRSLWVLLGM